MRLVERADRGLCAAGKRELTRRMDAGCSFAERLARALMGLLVVRFGGDETSERHQRQMQRALRYMEEPSMLSLAIDEWREEALAQGGRRASAKESKGRKRCCSAWPRGDSALISATESVRF